MVHGRGRRRIALGVLLALGAARAPAEEAPLEQPGAPRGELFASLYFGKAWNIDSDVDYFPASGTRIHYNDARWDDQSFRKPLYFGFRAGYWFHPFPNLGFVVDFTHAKAIAERPLPGLGHIEFSHGLNSVNFNLAYRWFPLGHRDGTLLGRLQPYAGIGAGISIPSIEVFSTLTDEYQVVGPNVQGFLGSHLDIWGPLALFAEYKINWADIDADLGNGGRVKTQIWTHQLLFGASLWLSWGDPPAR